MERRVNVVVVGGGAAGLAAAVEIERSGLTCQVLEAQPRLGGRVHSVQLADGELFDRGAQMVNGDMSSVLGLAREEGLHLSPIPSTGEDLCVFEGEVLSRDDFVSADEVEDMLQAHVAGWNSPREVLRGLWQKYQWWTTPWESFGEAGRAAMRLADGNPAPKGSLAEAMDKMLLGADDRAIACSMFREQYGAAPEVLNAVTLRNGLGRYQSERGDLEFQFRTGMGAIVEALAGRLTHVPLLDMPVTHIQAFADSVQVECSLGAWSADCAIVAAPPTAARQISFMLDRQAELDVLLGAFEAGDLIKTVLVYDRAFWRSKGWSGRVTFADPSGLEVADTSLDDGSQPRLTTFLGGPMARKWSGLSCEERTDRLHDLLGRALGDEARHPRTVSDAVWVDDRWSGGGYNATVRVGHRSDAVERLAAWPGRVRFAGAELDHSFAGYVEGAIRSGRNVAQQVAALV